MINIWIKVKFVEFVLLNPYVDQNVPVKIEPNKTRYPVINTALILHWFPVHDDLIRLCSFVYLNLDIININFNKWRKLMSKLQHEINSIINKPSILLLRIWRYQHISLSFVLVYNTTTRTSSFRRRICLKIWKKQMKQNIQEQTS